MNHFHIVWSIFTSIQIFSLIHCYLSTTPAQICHERTLILQQYCSTDLAQWRLYDWWQRLLERKKESDHDHVTNFKITITNLNLKFCIYYLKSWNFLNNWMSNFLEEGSSTICTSSTYIWEWRTEIKKINLVYRITRPFIKHNLRFRMQQGS